LGSLLAWLIGRAISSPIQGMTGTMTRLAGGDLRVDVPALGTKDEIGEMAKAVLVFRDAAVDKVRMEREAEEERVRSEESRRKAEEEAIGRERAMVSASIGAGMAKLAAKDLTFRLTDDLPEAYRKLQEDFNSAIEQLEQALQSVRSSAQAIDSGTQEISTAADDLSRRTEQQASSLEETAAALDEITATVKKAAEGAMHARKVVASTKEDAEKSGEIVRKAVEAMGGIEKSSQQISQIIGVIDEIAFQTNLLALNAGVEAARVGDAGRGFAVVASEVRALAQRSAEAAKEIKGLISASTTQVGQGVSLVADTGKSLEQIVGQVTEINTSVSNIAASAQEQATGLQQVNTAINQMDQVTQQNAAMAEEATAASRALGQEATSSATSSANFISAIPTQSSPCVGKCKSSPRRSQKRGQLSAGRPRPTVHESRRRRTRRRTGKSFRRTARLHEQPPGARGRELPAGDATMTEIARSTGTTPQELITFRVGGQEFCVDVMSVREIRGWTPATPVPKAPSFVRGVINLRGTVLPIVDLAARLGFKPAEPTARHAIMVTQVHRQVVGLLVDGVSDIVTITQDNIQPTPDVASDMAKTFVRGVIVLEGRLISLITLDNLLPQGEQIAA
jgi:methyl-accepting chemotaxis protein/chemotaxis signal transduction protein